MFYKFCVTITFLFSIFHFVGAQQLPAIITTEKYVRGIYRNIDEFLNNAPTIDRDFRVLRWKESNRKWIGDGEFGLFINDSLSSQVDLKRVWGVSTGEKIYINTHNYGFATGFEELKGLGRYCYWKGEPPMQSVMNFGAPITRDGQYFGGVGLFECGYILNPNNEKIFVLTKEIMRMILSDDAELLQDFNEENRKSHEEVLFQYVQRYNDRHTDEIDVGRFDVVFYRRQKNENPEPLNLLVNNSISIKIVSPGIIESSYSPSEIEVCLDGVCKNIKLSKQDKNYIECTFRKGSVKPSIKKVDKKEAEFHLHEVRYYLEKVQK